MKNDFKSFFNLDKEIESGKIINDHKHIRELKVRRLSIYGIGSVLGYLGLTFLYKIFTDKETFFQNLIFKNKFRLKLIQIYYKNFRINKYKNTILNDFNTLIKQTETARLNEKNINYLLKYINKVLCYVNYLKRENNVEFLNRIDRKLVKDLNNSILTCLANIANLYKEKYIHELIKLIELDIEVFRSTIEDNEVNYISTVLAGLDYHKDSIRFMFYYYNSSYYSTRHIINLLNNSNNPVLLDLK
jgi:hypothetical protein